MDDAGRMCHLWEWNWRSPSMPRIVKFGPLAGVLIAALWLSVGPIDAQTTRCEDPLMLDLSGSGVRTTSEVYPVLFDLDGDGIRTKVTWSESKVDVGILWAEANGNRTVDGGPELFGNRTRLWLHHGWAAKNGMEALAQYDDVRLGGNADHLITKDDEIWQRLQVWIDRNHDGLMQPQESVKLQELGIESISLAFHVLPLAESLDGHGNVHFARSTFTRRIHVAKGSPTVKTFVIEDVILHEAP